MSGKYVDMLVSRYGLLRKTTVGMAARADVVNSARRSVERSMKMPVDADIAVRLGESDKFGHDIAKMFYLYRIPLILTGDPLANEI